MEKNKEKIKVIKINGIKAEIVVPPKVNVEDIPEKLESKDNHPKGLLLTH